MLGLLIGATGVFTAVTASASSVSCGSSITVSTTLTSDVGPCTSGDGVDIAASGITLNLNGHSVIGALVASGPTAGTSTAYAGVHFTNVSGSTVENGTVEYFQAGVLLDGGSGNTVKGVTAHDNVGTTASNYGDGITADNGSSSNAIVNNEADGNGPYSGISLLTGASNNLISGNTVTNNSVPDLPQSGSSPFYEDMGIRVEGPSAQNNTVSKNTITGSATNGIGVLPVCHDAFAPTPTCAGDQGNTGTTLNGNTANANGFAGHNGSGINLFGMGIKIAFQPTGVTIVNNTTDGNKGDGILLQGTHCNPPFGTSYCSPTNNTVNHNTANGNDISGIALGIGAASNQVVNNTTNGNAVDGVALSTGATGNGLHANRGAGNTVWDGYDQNASCDSNNWTANRFGTVNQPCV